jgi:hypothetical protein
VKKRTVFVPNPNRVQVHPAMEKFVHKHEQMGIKPFEMPAEIPETVGVPTADSNSATASENHVMNFRKEPRRGAPVVPQNMPYATPAFVAPKNATMPNVGNNVEHSLYSSSFSSVEGMDYDPDMDSKYEADAKSIEDENNYVNLPGEEPVKSHSKSLSTLEVSEYLVILDDAILVQGSLKQAEEHVSALVLGEHPLKAGVQVPADEIFVLKRVAIRVGVFVE